MNGPRRSPPVLNGGRRPTTNAAFGKPPRLLLPLHHDSLDRLRGVVGQLLQDFAHAIAHVVILRVSQYHCSQPTGIPREGLPGNDLAGIIQADQSRLPQSGIQMKLFFRAGEAVI